MEIKTMLDKSDHLIVYTPFGDEPTIDGFINECKKTKENITIISKDKNSDPIKSALELKSKLSGSRVTVLLPGRSFDRSGNRVGRGGGWYDRFLNTVPKDWTRIGVLNIKHLSDVELTKNPWDEPMDFLLVQNNLNWEFYKTTTERDGNIVS